MTMPKPGPGAAARASFAPQVRGHLVIAIHAALERWGPGLLEEAAQSLPPEDAARFRAGRFGADDWFPIASLSRLFRLLDLRLGQAGLDAVAEQVAGGLFPPGYAATESVPRLVETATAAFRSVVDRGRLVVEEVEGGAGVTLIGVPEGGGAHCRWRAAVVAAVFRRAGAVDPRCEHPLCVATGGGWCEFRVRWRQDAN